MAGRNQHYSPAGSPSDDTTTGGGGADNMLDNSNSSSSSSLKDQDRYLPIANVSRIMKKALPTNAKISKEAKETVQECVSEFISFVTGEASDKCQKEKRKTINGDDLLWAMTTLGFENYVGSLKVYLNKYRETEEEKNCMARHGDHSPTKEEDTTATLDNIHSIVHGHGDRSFPGFNGSFFSLGGGAAGIPQNAFGGHQRHGRDMVYGDKSTNNLNSSFYMSAAATYDGEDKNAAVWY